MLDNNIKDININNHDHNIIIINDNDVVSISNISLIEHMMQMINDDKFNIRNLNGEFLYKDKFDQNIFVKTNDGYISKKYIGVLSIKKDDFLNNLLIKSRFDNNGDENFTNMLIETCYNMLNPLFVDAKNENEEDNEKDNNEFSILIKKYNRIELALSCFEFVSCLNNAIKKGMFRSYTESEHNDTKVKGRIDVSRHVIKNQSIQGKVCYTTREYTTDNVINRMILKTYILLERLDKNLLTNVMSTNKEAQKHIVKLKTMLPNIEEYGISDLINKGNSKITNMVYKEYESLRKVCLGILKSKGKYTYDINDTRINGIVINVDKLWSIYIYKTIIKHIDEKLKEEENNDSDMLVLMNNKNIARHDFVINIKNKRVLFDTSYSKMFEDYDNKLISSEDKVLHDNIIKDLCKEAKDSKAQEIYLIYPVKKKIESDYESEVKKLPVDNELTIYKVPFIIPEKEESYLDFKKDMSKSITSIEKIIEK